MSVKLVGVVGSMVAVLLVSLGMLRCHDDSVRRSDRAEQEVKDLEFALGLAVSTRKVTITRTDSAIRIVKVAVSDYKEQRARVDTIPRELSIPVGMVLVPIQFVRAADALEARVQGLVETVALERLASDSVIALQRSEIAQLKLQVAAVRPGIRQKATLVLAGGAIVAVAMLVLGRN